MDDTESVTRGINIPQMHSNSRDAHLQKMAENGEITQQELEHMKEVQRKIRKMENQKGHRPPSGGRLRSSRSRGRNAIGIITRPKE